MYTTKKLNEHTHSLSIRGRVVGEFYREACGFFVFEFSRRLIGYHPSHFFKYIYDKLEELNSPEQK